MKTFRKGLIQTKLKEKEHKQGGYSLSAMKNESGILFNK